MRKTVNNTYNSSSDPCNPSCHQASKTREGRSSPSQKSQTYAHHTVFYNDHKLSPYIKLTNEKGELLYQPSRDLPSELKETIKRAAESLFKKAEEEKRFSKDDPITNCTNNGVRTRKGHTIDLTDMPEWRAFAKAVGWDKKREKDAPSNPIEKMHRNHVMPITYPRNPISTIKGPELVLLMNAPLIHPVDLTVLSYDSKAPVNVKDAYDKLPVESRVRILNTLLLNPAIGAIGIYRWVKNELITSQQKKLWTQSTTEDAKTKDIEKAIREEIQKLKKDPSYHQFLDDVNQDTIDSLYEDFTGNRSETTPITEEMTWKIKHIMNRRLPHKETLVEHYLAIYRAKHGPKSPLPAFTGTPEAFSQYWFEFEYQKTPEQAEEAMTFIEAIASWADTKGAKLDVHYPQASRNPSTGDPTPILSKMLSLLEKIPRVSDYVPESFTGRKKEGWVGYGTVCDAVLTTASYKAWQALPIATTPALSTSQALTVYAPTCPLAAPSAAGELVPLFPAVSVAAYPLIALALYYKGDQIADTVIEAHDWTCDKINGIAEKLETPVNYIQETVRLAVWGPMKIYEGVAAIYHYGPLQRIKKAVRIFTEPVALGEK